ncbi:MAG: type I restriction enzyme HsdR N-terminal domain-containing protein [Simkaniaceae bacterium]|nr:type I restriction enzyme HsdR N-terminal domain-containing protein [Candidatus Sacchlamyda saccharinae]
MVLSKQKDKLFDSFRSSWVAATPEEIVRQKLLHAMTTQLGFPKSSLVVEKKLSELPHLRGKKGLPGRRADVLCFAKGIHEEHELFPLLLIECKEGIAREDAAQQALGYNYFVQAPYVAIAGEGSAQLVHPQRLDFLPHYHELLERVCKQ